MKISIDLNNIQTKSFKESEFLHQESRDKFIEIIEKNINLIRDDSCNRVHRSILIDGKRGYGKTSFILTMKEILNKKFDKELFILDIIDPTIVETKENVFILVLTIIKKEVEKLIKNPCREISESYKLDFEKILKKLSLGLSVLDGVGGASLFKENIWNESELILEDALKNTKGGNELESNFKEFIDISLKILGKEAFVLFFDDIDTAANQGEMILELIRKYFTSKRLFIVLLGDMELFSLIVRNMQWKKLSPTQIKSYESNLIKNIYNDEINTLTHQYLIKIIPTENIVSIKRLYDIANNIFINDIKIKEYIKINIIQNIFNEYTESKIQIFEDFLLNLPLRSIIQILSSKQDLKKINYILSNSLSAIDANNLSQVFNSFNSNQNDKYYLLYKYIKYSKFQEKDYTFLSQNGESSKDSLNILLNAYISQGTRDIQDIFDYFIKFYMPLEFDCIYDSNSHSFKISKYFIKDLRKNSFQSKILNGTIHISNYEYKKLNLTQEQQAIFNIFTVGLFTNNGLKNYFSFWNLFGFISNIFFYGVDINLDKLLQVKSYHLENTEDNLDSQDNSIIQEANYDTTNLRAWCIATKIRDQFFPYDDIKISARQLSSIWTRVVYSIKYIDENPSSNLSSQVRRYIQATLNAFIIVILESENGIKFNNALSLDSQIYSNNLEVLKKNKDKYYWLLYFVEINLWKELDDFFDTLDGISLTFDFYKELDKIDFDGNLREIKENILGKAEILYITDITKLISAIRGRKTLDSKTVNRLIKELERLKDRAVSRSRQ